MMITCRQEIVVRVIIDDILEEQHHIVNEQHLSLQVEFIRFIDDVAFGKSRIKINEI
jgi:hypothetical protein